MSDKFIRQYRLTIGAPNIKGATGDLKQSVIITELHMEFDIKITADSKQNTAEFKLYNLSKSTIAIFDVKDVLITLEVSYRGSPFVLLFKGEKAFMSTEKEDTDIITTVVAAEGFVTSREGRVQETLPKDSDLKDVINKIIKSGMPEIKTINIASDIPARAYTKGYAVTGSAKQALDKVCSSNNLLWHITKNDTINVFLRNGDTKVKAIVISPSSGLISAPDKTSEQARKLKEDEKEPKDAGIKFDCLLNPLIEAGQIVQLQDTFNSDGNYRVNTISHKGGYESDEWTTSIEATKL
jgi:hypothetical protein